MHQTVLLFQLIEMEFVQMDVVAKQVSGRNNEYVCTEDYIMLSEIDDNHHEMTSITVCSEEENKTYLSKSNRLRVDFKSDHQKTSTGD